MTYSLIPNPTAAESERRREYMKARQRVLNAQELYDRAPTLQNYLAIEKARADACQVADRIHLATGQFVGGRDA